MRITAAAGLAAALLACAGCMGTPRCRLGPMADTTGWQVVDAGDFVFKLPPGLREQEGRGVDSYVGTWAQGENWERWAGFEYGWYGGDPREGNRSDRGDRLCRERIGGRNAILRERLPVPAPEGSRYNLGAWWRIRKPADDVREWHLWMRAGTLWNDTEGRALAATVLRTVRFRTVWTPQDSLRLRHKWCERWRADAARMPEHPPAVERLRTCPTGPAPPPPDYERVH